MSKIAEEYRRHISSSREKTRKIIYDLTEEIKHLEELRDLYIKDLRDLER